MKDLSERLWPAFRAEVGEQLEALELQLVQRAAASVDSVNAMFRHFHTIKGGCAMMGFANMGALAHAAEDALDPVRRGEGVLDETLVDALLAAADALTQHLRLVEQTRRDGDLRQDIIERLRARIASAPVATVPVPQAHLQSSPAAAADALATQAFAERCEAQLPVLYLAALQSDVPDDFTAVAAALCEAADAAGLRAVANLLALLARFPADAHRRLMLVGEIADRLGALDADLRLGRVIAASRAEARDALHIALRATAARLARQLAHAADAEALAAADDLLAASQIAALPETTRLLRLCCQVLRDSVLRGRTPGESALALLALAADMPLDLAGDTAEDAPYVALCTSLYQRLQEAVARGAGGRDLDTLRDEVAARAGLDHGWLESLGRQACERLLATLQAGGFLAEIEAEMESAPDNGAAFVAWLDQSGASLGNQTVFHQQGRDGASRETTRLRFLTAWTQPLAEVRRALGVLDAGRRLYELRPCRADDAPVAVLETAASPTIAPVAAVAAASRTTADDEARNFRARQTLRVDSEAVDQFVSRIGELVTLRNMMAHALQSDEVTARHRRARALLGQRVERQLSPDELDELRRLLADLDDRHEQLVHADLRIQGALGRMQEDVLALRVLPVGTVFNRLPRAVRDLCQTQQKVVHLDLSGEDVRIDKSLVDVLHEPLMHLVRNAIDHGIELPAHRKAAGKPETATLRLAARQQGGLLLIEVSDDGRGLDRERIRRRALEQGLATADALAAMGERDLAQMIFLPGFSTAERITELSGRGVGMDVVKTSIAQVGGHVDVRSEPGRGTCFTLRLPLSVAIQAVVLVEAGGRQLALPERSVAEILSLPVSALQSVQGQACCLLRGAVLPVYALDALLGHASGRRQGQRIEIVVIGDGLHRIGLLVDAVIGRPEVYVRDVHADIARLPGVGGVSVLGNGQVVIILDGEKLLVLALQRAQALRSLLDAS